MGETFSDNLVQNKYPSSLCSFVLCLSLCFIFIQFCTKLHFTYMFICLSSSLEDKLYKHFVVAQSLSHVQLFCDPVDCSPPGSSVHGISQARILEWIAIFSPRASSPPRDQTCLSCLAGGFLTTEPPRKPFGVCISSLLQSTVSLYILRVIFPLTAMP